MQQPQRVSADQTEPSSRSLPQKGRASKLAAASSDTIDIPSDTPPCAPTKKHPAANSTSAAGTAGTADTERKPRPWLAHLEGRTLVEGTADAFRHPKPEWPDPIATLLPLGENGLEQICVGLVNHMYPEGEYAPDKRERMRDASRRRFVDGMHDGHVQFRREIEEFKATLPDEAKRMCERHPAEDSPVIHQPPHTCRRHPRPPPPRVRRERRIADDPCSDESCKVLSAHYVVAIMRKSGVLESRRELQDAELLEYDCPVCQETLEAGDGIVTFHVLECGHRCAFPPFFLLRRRRALTWPPTPLSMWQGPQGVHAQH